MRKAYKKEGWLFERVQQSTKGKRYKILVQSVIYIG